MDEDQRLLLTAREAGELLHVGRTTIYEYLSAGLLPTLKVGRSIRIPRAALERWIEQNTHGGDGSVRRPDLD